MNVKPNKLKIFLDVDNVVAHWSLHAIETMGMNPEDPELYARLSSQECVTGIVDADALWQKIGVAGANWWHQIKPLPWARKLWCVCNKIAPTTLLTKPWNGAGTDIMGAAADGKVRWARDFYKTDHLHIAVHKEFCASPHSLLIDDSTENCEKFREAGGFAFHWPNPWVLTKQRSWNMALLNLMAFIEIVVDPNLSPEELSVIRVMQETLRRTLPPK